MKQSKSAILFAIIAILCCPTAQANLWQGNSLYEAIVKIFQSKSAAATTATTRREPIAEEPQQRSPVVFNDTNEIHQKRVSTIIDPFFLMSSGLRVWKIIIASNQIINKLSQQTRLEANSSIVDAVIKNSSSMSEQIMAFIRITSYYATEPEQQEMCALIKELEKLEYREIDRAFTEVNQDLDDVKVAYREICAFTDKQDKDELYRTIDKAFAEKVYQDLKDARVAYIENHAEDNDKVMRGENVIYGLSSGDRVRFDDTQIIDNPNLPRYSYSDFLRALFKNEIEYAKEMFKCDACKDK